MPKTFKINVQEFANTTRISLAAAHELIQPALFKQSWKWRTSGKQLDNTSAPYLYLERNYILHGNDDVSFDVDTSTLSVPSLTVEFTEQPETITIEGRCYLRSDIMKLTPIDK